jgi:hypothetical protein
MKDIMVYKDFKQPNIIDIDDNIRLRAYDGNYKQAVSWYQDPVVYYNSEGITDISKIPEMSKVKSEKRKFLPLPYCKFCVRHFNIK